MTDSNSITTTEGDNSFLTNTNAFEHTWRVATAFSKSKMVPATFQSKPEDCMVALMMAQQLGVNPLLALQNIQLIHGRPGFSASFAIGLANERGPFNGPITWTVKGKGDSLAVTAKATIKATGEIVGNTVSMEIAKAEGWTKNPKYKTMPEQMLRYRSAVWLIRSHCPEVLMGFPSSDEMVDIQPMQRVNEVETGSTVASLNSELMEGAKKVEQAIKLDKKNKEVLEADFKKISESEEEPPETQEDFDPFA